MKLLSHEDVKILNNNISEDYIISFDISETFGFSKIDLMTEPIFYKNPKVITIQYSSYCEVGQRIDLPNVSDITVSIGSLQIHSLNSLLEEISIEESINSLTTISKSYICINPQISVFKDNIFINNPVLNNKKLAGGLCYRLNNEKCRQQELEEKKIIISKSYSIKNNYEEKQEIGLNRFESNSNYLKLKSVNESYQEQYKIDYNNSVYISKIDQNYCETGVSKMFNINDQYYEMSNCFRDSRAIKIDEFGKSIIDESFSSERYV